MVIWPKSIVPKVGEPDIDESYIRQQDVVVLEMLLIDRTMTARNGGSPVNIKWAVDDYAKEYPDGTGYGCEEQIAIDAISGGDGKDLKVVTPRVKKRKEEQERRTAQKAEVFTPSWICNEQNNLVDEAWFDRKDKLFNKPKQAEHGYSKIRNDGLAQALSYMKEVEGWGGGVARYFSDWTAAGLPRPKLEETPGFFKVIFDRKKKAKANEPVNEPVNGPVNEPLKMAVVQAVRKNPGIGRPALMRIVGKSRATMTRILSELVAQRLVEHRGSDKTGGYFPVASAHKEAK